MKRVSSAVWQFFDRIEENGRCVSVSCKICANEYKYFGNTTNLRIHLSKKHPFQWEFRQNNVDCLKTDDSTPVRQVVANERIKTSKRNSYANNDVDTDTDTELDNAEEDAETQNMVKQIHASDEEWLDEDLVNVTYEPKNKRMRHKIKREVVTPPRLANSRKRTTQALAATMMPNVVGRFKDEYDVFGEYIANKLRKLGKSRAQGNVQQIISTIIWQADFGTYDNADTVKRVLMASMQESDKMDQVSDLHTIEEYNNTQLTNDADTNPEIDHSQ